jgi:hypothetical protein
MSKFIQQHEQAMEIASSQCQGNIDKWPDAKKVVDTNSASVSIWHKIENKIDNLKEHHFINDNDSRKLKH